MTEVAPPGQATGKGSGDDDGVKSEIKCVVIGDAAVGKTCMLISYTTNKFPSEYTPTVFDNYTTKINVDGEVVKFHLWDTAGSEHFDLLRPLSYSGTNVFVICYAVADKKSFDNVKSKWAKDLKEKVPHIPFMVVATKVDLRKMSDKKGLITTKQGQDMAKDVGAKYFVECSSITQEGLKECFNNAISIALSGGVGEAQTSSSGGCCIIM